MHKKNQPSRNLSNFDAVCLIVGMLIGAGIFKAPSVVAGHMASGADFLMLWVLGGLISVIGALCYAELAATYPSAAGEYHFLSKAMGRHIAFFHAWAKVTVITTGSIAILAFTLGDYMSVIYPLGDYSSFIWAGGVIVFLSAVNFFGIKQTKWFMNALTIAEILGIFAIVYAGFSKNEMNSLAELFDRQSESSQYGLAMVFVLLAYGGWNEVAYLSAEVKDDRHGIAKPLFWGLAAVMLIYCLINFAYLSTLGLLGLSQSHAVAYDVFIKAFGKESAILFSVIVILSCLNSLQATMVLGARSTFALGRDYRVFAWLGNWHSSGHPRNSLLAQSVASLAVVVMAVWTRQGFETVVEFTAPVFWFFILLVGVSLFRLRHLEPDAPRPFRVPFYPVVPLMFIAVTAWMLWSSLLYTGKGAWVGVFVLFSGVIPLGLNLFLDKKQLRTQPINEASNKSLFP